MEIDLVLDIYILGKYDDYTPKNLKFTKFYIKEFFKVIACCLKYNYVSEANQLF